MTQTWIVQVVVDQCVIKRPIDDYNQLTLRLLSRLKDHVNDKTKLPILIFPEGECSQRDYWGFLLKLT